GLGIRNDELRLWVDGLWNIDRNGKFCRTDWRISELARDLEPSGIENKGFVQHTAVDGDAFCRAGKPQGSVNDEIAVWKRQGRSCVSGLSDELVVSVGPQLLFKNPPLQALPHRLRVIGGKLGRKMHDAARPLPGSPLRSERQTKSGRGRFVDGLNLR